MTTETSSPSELTRRFIDYVKAHPQVVELWAEMHPEVFRPDSIKPYPDDTDHELHTLDINDRGTGSRVLTSKVMNRNGELRLVLAIPFRDKREGLPVEWVIILDREQARCLKDQLAHEFFREPRVG